MNTKNFTAEQVLTLRKKLELNQTNFWNRIGITQSGGSRYESGRDIPAPVQTLLAIAYGTETHSARIVKLLRGTCHGISQ